MTRGERIAKARHRVADLHQAIVEAQEIRERIAACREPLLVRVAEAHELLDLIEQRARAEAEQIEVALCWLHDLPPAV